MSIAQVSAKVLVSTLPGILAGGLTAALYFTVVNIRAEDGPYFPPAMLASVVVILGAFVLLPFQLAVLAWHRRKGPLGLWGGLAMGVISGGVAGLTLAFVVFASRHSISNVLSFMLIGMVQGCATLTCLGYVARGTSRRPGPP